jgi:hypothetical protein
MYKGLFILVIKIDEAASVNLTCESLDRRTVGILLVAPPQNINVPKCSFDVFLVVLMAYIFQH